MNAIEIRDLSKSYKDFNLEHLNLTLPGGCIMGLVGENGAGKSTTIKLILNMIHRDGGSISILGRENVTEMQSLKEDIGVVLDEVGLPECLNRRQVGNIMALTFKNWDSDYFEALCVKLGVPDQKKFGEYSKGMKMKIGIAVAMSHHPKLLILDEATSGLDPVVRDDVLDLLNDFTRDEDHAVLVSSHIVSDLEKICDYIAFMHQGQLVLCEEKDRLTELYGLIRCSAEQLKELNPQAVIGKSESPYGVDAVVRRAELPAGWEVSPIDIEELFVMMVRGRA